jgi:hypothetical protein
LNNRGQLVNRPPREGRRRQPSAEESVAAVSPALRIARFSGGHQFFSLGLTDGPSPLEGSNCEVESEAAICCTPFEAGPGLYAGLLDEGLSNDDPSFNYVGEDYFLDPTFEGFY